MVIAIKDALAKNLNKTSSLSAKFRIQWLAVTSSHIITFVHGIAIGWFSPIVLDLQSEKNTPLDFSISVDDASWIGTSWGVGMFFSTVIMGQFINKVGRKRLMFLLALPHLPSWCLIYFAKNVWYFYAARFLAGFTGGALFLVLPLYASEIADNCVRGAMSSFIMTIWSVGLVVGYVLSSYVDYFVIPCIAICIPITYILAISFFPETPQSLLKAGKIAEAERSFRFYKRIQSDNDPDLQNFEALKNHLCNSNVNTAVTWSDLTNKSAIKCFTTAIVLASCNQLSGTFSMTQYMAYIFEAAESQMDINLCTIILGVVQIIACTCGFIFVDYIGRRRIMLWSIGSMSFGWFLFGGFLQFTSAELKAKLFWAPLAIMIFIMFVCSCGLLAIFSVVLLEIFPTKIRATGAGVTIIYLSILMTIQLRIYLLELIYLGAANTMYLAAVVNLLTYIYMFFNLDETKNKEIDLD